MLWAQWMWRTRLRKAIERSAVSASLATEWTKQQSDRCIGLEFKYLGLFGVPFPVINHSIRHIPES